MWEASDRFYWLHREAENNCQPISGESRAALENHGPSTVDPTDVLLKERVNQV